MMSARWPTAPSPPFPRDNTNLAIRLLLGRNHIEARSLQFPRSFSTDAPT